MKKILKYSSILTLFLALALFAGCDDAGDDVEAAGENLEDAAEKTADSVEDAAEDAADEIGDAVD
jgi:predicted small secreted protein